MDIVVHSASSNVGFYILLGKLVITHSFRVNHLFELLERVREKGEHLFRVPGVQTVHEGHYCTVLIRVSHAVLSLDFGG